jgi:hypothetical protein
MKSKYYKLLIILVSVLALILLVDIFMGFWFWHKGILIWDANNFNNIITPIATILGVIVYAVSLWFMYKQNRIIQSQSIKLYYDNRIDKFIDEQDKVIDYISIAGKSVNFSFRNYIKKLSTIYIELEGDSDFEIDSKSTTGIKTIDIEKKPYYAKYKGVFYSISATHVFTNLYHYHLNVYHLGLKILHSKLTNDDKKVLVDRIEEELINDYMHFVKPRKGCDTCVLKFPIRKDPTNKSQTFVPIHKTEFGQFYTKFKSIIDEIEKLRN